MTRGERRKTAAGGLTIGLLAISLVAFAAPASAAAYENSVGLGTASSFSVLGAQATTNTGPSTLSGDLGVSPGTSITGSGSAVVGGATHLNDAVAAQAQSDLTVAYNDAAGRTPTGTALGSAMAGGTFQPGVYKAASALGVSGTVTLDGLGDPNSVFIFQVPSALTTATSTSIVLVGQAKACNVFWQVGSSATLGVTNVFVGTVMALTSITVNTGTTVQGRALARNGAVTLDDDVFTTPSCATTSTTTTVTATPSTTGGTTTLTATVASGGGAAAPTGGTVTFRSNGTVIGSAPVTNGIATLTVAAGTVVGNQTITATYTGVGLYTASTSTATNLVVTATPTLPDTGTNDIGVLLGTGGGALLLGLILILMTRPYSSRHSTA